MVTKNKLHRTVVLIGGNGSNLQALIDSQAQGAHINLVGVVSHRANVYGIERAKQAGIPVQVVEHQQFADRSAFEFALKQAIAIFKPNLLVMAGFMRVLSADFVNNFPGQLLNIHPSLLPKFKGLNTHQRVLEVGEKEHGASVHFVTAELDSGPLIAQVTVPILPNDDANSLNDRVLSAEHWLYPQVVEWYSQNRLKYSENIVTLDNKRVGPQGMQLRLPTIQGMPS